MSINNFNDYMVNKVSHVTVVQKISNSKTKQQSKNSFSKILKKAAIKVSADSQQSLNTLEERNPFNGNIGKA